MNTKKAPPTTIRTGGAAKKPAAKTAAATSVTPTAPTNGHTSSASPLPSPTAAAAAATVATTPTGTSTASVTAFPAAADISSSTSPSSSTTSTTVTVATSSSSATNGTTTTPAAATPAAAPSPSSDTASSHSAGTASSSSSSSSNMLPPIAAAAKRSQSTTPTPTRGHGKEAKENTLAPTKKPGGMTRVPSVGTLAPLSPSSSPPANNKRVSPTPGGAPSGKKSPSGSPPPPAAAGVRGGGRIQTTIRTGKKEPLAKLPGRGGPAAAAGTKTNGTNATAPAKGAAAATAATTKAATPPQVLNTLAAITSLAAAGHPQSPIPGGTMVNGIAGISDSDLWVMGTSVSRPITAHHSKVPSSSSNHSSHHSAHGHHHHGNEGKGHDDEEILAAAGTATGEDETPVDEEGNGPEGSGDELKSEWDGIDEEGGSVRHIIPFKTDGEWHHPLVNLDELQKRCRISEMLDENEQLLDVLQHDWKVVTDSGLTHGAVAWFLSTLVNGFFEAFYKGITLEHRLPGEAEFKAFIRRMAHCDSSLRFLIQDDEGRPLAEDIARAKLEESSTDMWQSHVTGWHDEPKITNGMTHEQVMSEGWIDQETPIMLAFSLPDLNSLPPQTPAGPNVLKCMIHMCSYMGVQHSPWNGSYWDRDYIITIPAPYNLRLVVAGCPGSPLPADQWRATHGHPHWSAIPSGTISQIRQWGFYEGNLVKKPSYAMRYGLPTEVNPFRIDPAQLIPLVKLCHIPPAAFQPWTDMM